MSYRPLDEGGDDRPYPTTRDTSDSVRLKDVGEN